MSKAEKEAIEELKSHRKYFEFQPAECNWRLSFDTEEVHRIIDVIINLIEKQNKVIDKMADNMYNRPAYINLPYMKTKEEIKEYFYKEIEDE